ncbi:MAG: hypothetical protein K2X01_02190 [Cyanobacteria bacterium]|nr:hypothetical protein [Cyanobacteriota bacterium]
MSFTYPTLFVFAAAPANMQSIRDDLQAIDRQIFSDRKNQNQKQNQMGRQPQLEPITVTLSKTSIRARDVYRRYMTQAADVSQQLLHVRQDILVNGGSVSLQRLGAISQGLNSQNVLLKNALQNGETDFESYQLIQKAIAALDDATQYWRSANRYRPIYRGAGFEENEDNQLLKVKLQTAMTAIEQLQRIVDTQNTLQKGLEKAEF